MNAIIEEMKVIKLGELYKIYYTVKLLLSICAFLHCRH